MREHKNICGNFSCDFMWSQLPLWNKSFSTAVKSLEFIQESKWGREEVKRARKREFTMFKQIKIENTTSKRWRGVWCCLVKSSTGSVDIIMTNEFTDSQMKSFEWEPSPQMISERRKAQTLKLNIQLSSSALEGFRICVYLCLCSMRARL